MLCLETFPDFRFPLPSLARFYSYVIDKYVTVSFSGYLSTLIKTSRSKSWMNIFFFYYVTNVQEMNRSIEQHGWQISRVIVYVSIIYMQLKPDVQIMSNNCSWSNGCEREYVILQSLIIKFMHCLLKLEN